MIRTVILALLVMFGWLTGELAADEPVEAGMESEMCEGQLLLELSLVSKRHEYERVVGEYRVLVSPEECPWEIEVFGPGDANRHDNLLLPPSGEWENWNGIGSIYSWICPSPLEKSERFPPDIRKIPVRSTSHEVCAELVEPRVVPKERGGLEFKAGFLRVFWKEG